MKKETLRNYLFPMAFLMAILLSFNGHAQNPFSCNSDLYQVVNGRDLNLLDPSTGIYTTIGSSSINYNGAGFNSEDNFIYGIGSGNILVRIDNAGQATDLGAISNFSALSFSGDFDTQGDWHSFRNVNGGWIRNVIDVSVSPAVAVESAVTELSGVANAANCADISYNPVAQMFYGMNAGRLTEFDPIASTVRVIADFSSQADGGSYGAVWSDNTGNTYFFNNNTGNVYRATIDENGAVSAFGFIATTAPNSSNDGMNCALGAPPVFPEICDNGLDDDGDGLIDCEDPDCTSTVSCGVSGAIFATDFTCKDGIATYHTFYTNNSTLTNTVTVSDVLPNGFIFLQDTLEFDAGGSSNFTNQPVEGDTGAIQWGDITLEGGETVRISYDVTFDPAIASGDYSNQATASLSNPGTIFDPATLSASMTLANCPTPNTYDCEPAFYQVYKKRGKNQPNVYGRLDPITGDYNQIAIASDYANGLGYDINTGLVFGASGKSFIQLDEDGMVIDLGIRFNKNVFRGDIDQSSRWYGVDGSDIVVIDVSGTPQVIATYPGEGVPGWDIAYNEDGHFYSVHKGRLYQFNTTTNTSAEIATMTGVGVPVTGGYGAQWTGSDGYLYASHNASGSIIRVDVTTGESRIVSTSVAELSKNDGFSCPLEIPAVYEFDYGDNNHLPQSRVLSYKQDLNSDKLPDYPMVWLGNIVGFDATDPSNATADGDDDDGVGINTRIVNDSITVSLGLNATANLQAYYGFAIDWDDNGTFDEVILGQESLTGASTVNLTIPTPSGFIVGTVNARAIVSEMEITASNLTGDIIAMGEVEDYRALITSDEVCDNGIDDDGDGLTDCDDPDCSDETETCPEGETNPGGDGGLESNNRLSEKIAEARFLRNKSGRKLNFDNKASLPLLRKKANYGQKITSRNSKHLDIRIENFIPIDVLEGTETFVTSPDFLTDITNAEEAYSVDIFRGESRVGAVLALTTPDGVYEHTKYVCDRLTGSRIEDILTYPIDGTNDFQIARFTLPNGHTEYATSFSIRQGEAGDFILESFWNIDFYTKNEAFYNFQIWANSTKSLIELSNEILRLLEVQQPISTYSLGDAPGVFINQADLRDGMLSVQLTNRNESTELLANGQVSVSETSTTEPFSQRLALTGNETDSAYIEVGSAYDLGVTIHDEVGSMPDVIFLADGAWGLDYNNEVEQVNEFEIIPAFGNDPDSYAVERDVQVEGQVLNSVSVFRAFSPSFRSENLDAYDYFFFSASGAGHVEITLVKSNITEWEEQPRVILDLTDERRTYGFTKEDFAKGINALNDWSNLTMVVFDFRGNSTSAENFQMDLAGVRFGRGVVSSAEAEVEALGAHSVYPNPVTDVMNLTFEASMPGEFEVQLFNQEGRLVKSYQGNAVNGSNSMSLQDLPKSNGLYFYQINLPNGISYQGKVLLATD